MDSNWKYKCADYITMIQLWGGRTVFGLIRAGIMDMGPRGDEEWKEGKTRWRVSKYYYDIVDVISSNLI